MHSHSLATQVLNLVWHEGALVGRCTTEWKRIHWVLRMFLMENVLAFTILPVGENLLVVTSGLDWCVLCGKALLLCSSTRALLPLENILHSCGHFHLVWVDNFGLLLHIESVFMISSKCIFSGEFFLIV